MRKAAATSLVALLAAVVPLAPPSSTLANIEGPNARERLLDEWIDQRMAPTKGRLADLLAKNGKYCCYTNTDALLVPLYHTTLII